jgi:hypothetical protein
VQLDTPMKGLRDWNGYVPEFACHEPPPDRSGASINAYPLEAGAGAIFFEFDDGNGMWIIPGVS